MFSARIGDAFLIRSAFNFQFMFRGFFLVRLANSTGVIGTPFV
jgi:hypothetical protein